MPAGAHALAILGAAWTAKHCRLSRIIKPAGGGGAQNLAEDGLPGGPNSTAPDGLQLSPMPLHVAMCAACMAKPSEDEAEMKRLLQVAVAVLCAGSAAVCSAQGTRAGKWEFTLQPLYSESFDVSGNGSKADVESAWGFGMGFAYNLSDNFSIGGDFSWSQADYTATVSPAAGNPTAAYSVDGEIETSTLRLNATWNILKSAFTPFITGGVGATYVDTNIPNGPPQNYCWYDPWWGYYCGTSVPTKDDTYFSYMAGAGVRWDSPGSFFLRGLVAEQWIDVGGSAGSPGVIFYRIDLGWRF
jgi:opacity protein-like surface antigen